jgi:NADP-dependent aldehyde dehydrogenase
MGSGHQVAARDALAQSPATPMLTPGIAENYTNGVNALSGEADLIVRGESSDSQTSCRAALFATDAPSFVSSEALQAEVFGSSSLVVRCADATEMHADESDYDDARQLVPLLELKAGRILFDGWPTGVERFLRPVAYQNVPKALLPSPIADDNPDHLWRRIDGRRTQD